MNLFGISSIKNYEDYLNNWVAIGKPRLLSFDNYPVWDDNHAQKYGQQIGFDWGKDYYFNLEFFRNYSVEYNIPFWNWISVHKHFSHYSKKYYRRATPAEISFQIFSSLMYGRKEFYIITFGTLIKDLNQNGWNEEEAILNPDGTETEMFEAVKRINAKAQKIGSVLMNLESVGVYHTSNNNVLRKKSEGIEFKTKKIYSIYLLRILGRNMETNENNKVLLWAFFSAIVGVYIHSMMEPNFEGFQFSLVFWTTTGVLFRAYKSKINFSGFFQIRCFTKLSSIAVNDKKI